jgi:hypothetical protein
LHADGHDGTTYTVADTIDGATGLPKRLAAKPKVKNPIPKGGPEFREALSHVQATRRIILKPASPPSDAGKQMARLFGPDNKNL